jgi:hypothetical protein
MFIDLYTECLERAGVEGNLIDVIDELLLIKEYHFSKTMSRRMNGTIINLCIIHKRKDVLFELYKSQKIEEINNPILEEYLEKNLELTANDFFSILQNLKFKIQITKGYEKLFIKSIEKTFNDLYSCNTIPINKIYKGQNITVKEIRLYNWNLYHQIGHIKHPEIWFEENLNREINKIYSLCYEHFKLLKKELRKQKSSK